MGAKAKAKNTTVIPSNQKPGQYTVTHNGHTYNYSVVSTPGPSGGKYVNEIYFYDYNADGTDPYTGRALVADGSKLVTWVPPATFFPPGMSVGIYDYRNVTLAAGAYAGPGISYSVLGKTITGKKPKQKKKKPPAFGEPPTVTLDDFGIGRFNPPPHLSSRTLSPVSFPNYNATDASADAIINQLASANNRGFFYQDLDSTLPLNGKQRKKSELWGFVFMYNPTTVTYTNQINTI